MTRSMLSADVMSISSTSVNRKLLLVVLTRLRSDIPNWPLPPVTNILWEQTVSRLFYAETQSIAARVGRLLSFSEIMALLISVSSLFQAAGR